MAIKESKAQKIVADAQKAWDAGHWVFTPVFNFPHFNMGFSGWNEDITRMAEAPLSVGWRLDTWSVVADNRGNPQVMPLYVRPGVDVRA